MAGSHPRDEAFLEKLQALDEDRMMIYPLSDPQARIKGLSQHPLQRVVRNQAVHWGRKFHSFKWLDSIYVVRLKVPNDSALHTKIATSGATNANQSRNDADGVGTRSSQEGNLRTPSGGSSDST